MISVIISLNALIICYQDIFFFLRQLDMLITAIGIITIGTSMLGTTFGIEIVMIIKNVSFH